MYTDDVSSDEEDDATNKIGRVPLHWYEGYDHIGYDLGGEKVIPSSSTSGLGNYYSDGELRVYDKLNGREVILSARETEILKRIQQGAFAAPETEMYPDYVDYYTHKHETSGLYKDQYEPKRRFTPSKYEKHKIAVVAAGLKSGRLKTRSQLNEERAKASDPETLFLKDAHALWIDDEEGEKYKGAPRLPAPKPELPGHADSYRPPDEYLNEDESNQKHTTLRALGAYRPIVAERFERCMDLYLCPRGLKRRLNIDPDSLIPKLPSPNELRPFPNSVARSFHGHTVPVVALSCSPDGQFLSSVDDAAVVKIWEILTARCLLTVSLASLLPLAALKQTNDLASDIAWNPELSHHVLAVATKSGLVILNTSTARTDDDIAFTDTLLQPPDHSNENDEEEHRKDNDVAEWTSLDSLKVLHIKLAAAVRKISWHTKGDYIVSTSPTASPSRQVVIHRLSTKKSQAPLRKTSESIQTARFHPDKPFLFVATKTTIKIFHLLQQTLVKVLPHTGSRWISDMELHSSGDHVVIGGCDKKLVWLDLDMGSKPYKLLQYHDRALRCIRFHSRYPLLASAADDGHVFILHTTVYSDLLKDPLIVPVHRFLKAHPPSVQHNNLGVLGLTFHPTQPWLFSAGADSLIHMYHSLL